METRIISLFSFLLVSSMTSHTFAQSQEKVENCLRTKNSYLWRINASPPIFLFGTMHVPYTRLWEFIPENVKTAFSSSEELYLELELLDHNTLRRLSKCRLLPSGSRIENLLSEGLISRITKYLAVIKEALPKWMHRSGSSFLLGGAQSSENLFRTFVGNWKRLRPVWILYLLGSLTEERTRLNQVPVVDTFLERAAKSLGKGVEAIEEPEDQCRPFNRLPIHQIELALQVQLDYLETLINGPRYTLEDDINSYRCGDFSHIVNHTPLLPIPSLDDINTTSPNLTETELSMLRSTETSLHRQLVVKRNRKMAQQIQALLESPGRNKTFFMGLGAGHYLTERNSIISRLRRKGYDIEHIPAELQLNGSSLPDNVVALGDPSTVTRLLHIEEVVPEPPQPSSLYGLLSAERLEAIFNKYLPMGGSQTSATTAPSGRQARSYIPAPEGPGAKEGQSLWQESSYIPAPERLSAVPLWQERLQQLQLHSNGHMRSPTSSAASNHGYYFIASLTWVLLMIESSYYP